MATNRVTTEPIVIASPVKPFRKTRRRTSPDTQLSQCGFATCKMDPHYESQIADYEENRNHRGYAKGNMDRDVTHQVASSRWKEKNAARERSNSWMKIDLAQRSYYQHDEEEKKRRTGGRD